MKKKSKHVYCFVAIHCVNGSCPKALANEHRERDDDALMAYADCGNMSCRDCIYYTDKCEDCIFEGSEECPERKEPRKAGEKDG